MRYCVSIDWLSLFCRCSRGGWCECDNYNGEIGTALPYKYEVQTYGTRHYRHLVKVSYLEEEICEVQYDSYSAKVMPLDSVIVKFHNRLLYSRELWSIVEKFLSDHCLTVQNISRIDLCADFNAFRKYDCVQFIADFLSSKLRHKGRGLGGAYFNHYTKKIGRFSVGKLDYTGLSFGSRSSDARVYMYNKTLELNVEKDKPYIKDFWRCAGLDTTRDVWRLEVSLKSGAMKFKDKKTKAAISCDLGTFENDADMLRIFHTYRHKLFSFVLNRAGITNISREPVIELFDNSPYYDRQVIRNVTGSTRTERILIKQLWQMSKKYRALDDDVTESTAKGLAVDLARGADLVRWFEYKRVRWTKPERK